MKYIAGSKSAKSWAFLPNKLQNFEGKKKKKNERKKKPLSSYNTHLHEN
jgi:hypothetical protein